jgi:hypothetical protein
MKNYFFVGAFLLTVTLDLFMVGCSKSPISPVRVTALNISIPMTNEIRAEFLGNSINSLIYRVDGDGGVSLLEGDTGPFAAPASTGAIDLTVNLPPSARLLSLHLGTYQIIPTNLGPATEEAPLAVGALGLDTVEGGNFNATVDLGSVVRNCYSVAETQLATGAPSPYSTGSAYGFANDNLIAGNFAGTAYDIGFNCPLGPFYMMEAQDNTTTPSINAVAFMGNGKLVDHDGVPPDSRFYPLSTQAKFASGAPVSTLEANDVYCVKLGTMPGHAWIQITDPGTMGTTGPSFCFRVNKTLPYYAYDETAADLGNNCSGSW